LRHDGWPLDPWDALRRLVLMLLQALTPTARVSSRQPAPRLALSS